MKKLGLLLVAFVAVLVTGCTTEQGDYTEGTYFAQMEGSKGVVTAVVFVGEAGMIDGVFIDTGYLVDVTTEVDGEEATEKYSSTKKYLGDDYGMVGDYSDATLEWYEQIELLEEAVVENQGIDFIEMLTGEDEGHSDSVAGVTIGIEEYYEVLNDALEKAKAE